MNLAQRVKTSVTKQDLNLVLEYLYRNTLINVCLKRCNDLKSLILAFMYILQTKQ